MATENLEQIVKELQEEVKSLKHEIERTQAINEIQNLFGKAEYLHTAGRDMESADFYAKRSDVRIYLGEQGYWEGIDAPIRIKSMSSGRTEADRIGSMPLHMLTTPVIEVAKDGKTAKGVWVAAGIVAGKNRETGEPRCGWEWDKYGIDFIKEDGKWKFWHFHIFRIFHGLGWDDKWADQFDKPDHLMDFPDELKPDGPAVDDNPYRPDTLQRLVPVPPEPYETFDTVDMY